MTCAQGLLRLLWGGGGRSWSATGLLPGDVCLTLLQPYYKKGHNVITDNCFTSLKLAEELKQKKTTILGTIRKQRREVPSTELIMKDKELYASEIFPSPSGYSLTIYKAKKKKVVCTLSSMHRNVNIDQCHKKNCQGQYSMTISPRWAWMYWTRWLDTIPARVPLEDGLWLYFLIFLTVPA